ncbi:MAG: shikimate dehydrogenase [Rikenellaceae bacterium]
MRKFGLIGEHLPHSFSGRYFADKFERELISDCEYRLYELAKIEEVEGLLAMPELEGFNITIPYKQQIMPYLTQLSPEAEAVGAVNCVKIDGEELVGYNTDIIGLGTSLRDFLDGVAISQALVLGTGGASLAVEYILRELGIGYRVVSRTPKEGQGQIAYSDITPDVISEVKFIINATPLGTFPNVETKPDLRYDLLTEDHYLFDLVYNPAVTKFLELGAASGAHTCNGEAMLIGQAEAAWEIWNR